MSFENIPLVNVSWMVFLLGAYVAGSVPFGQIISRRTAGIDITQKGSGNIGATNVAREIGISWGILTLLLDLAKGFIPVILGKSIFSWGPSESAIIGLAAFLGHQFSLFQQFKGGKGVATALGVFLAVSPGGCLISLCFFILTVVITDFVSLGSIVSAALMPAILLLLDKPGGLCLTALIIALLITVKHRENIQRLMRGEESKWRKRNTTSEP